MTVERKRALQLIVLFGLVSLFGDIVYEGARSVNGPYLKVLGTNAAIVGLIAGVGEFLGYAVRLISGYYADKTKAYWLFTFIGYGLLISVPLLSLTGSWQIASFFIICERFGKALRSPARDTIVSQATKQVGTGFGFGLNEALDQIGALTGPLIFMALFMAVGSKGAGIHEYQKGYALLWIPFVVLMLCVVVAYIRVPNPEELEKHIKKSFQTDKLSKTFWLYLIFTFMTTAGFINFVILGYHFKSTGILSDAQIPFFYALAMAVDGAAALMIGKIYDSLKERNKNEHGGLLTLISIPILTAVIPALVFLRSFAAVVVSVIIWGIVMGIHETIMKSAIADITPLKKRGTGYGVFNTAYGLAMLIGSTVMGYLYDKSIGLLIFGSITVQIVSIPVFYKIWKRVKEGADGYI